MPFHIVRNDIVLMNTDAIVNTANPYPTYGDGVDTAIHEAAGPQLLKWREEIGELKVGQAVSSPSFNLNCKTIIHVIGPVWEGGNNNEEADLAKCYSEALRIASEKGCESIAFPLISSGSYRFPKDKALSIATSEIQKFLYTSDMTVYLVVYDKTAFSLSSKINDDIKSYIDSNYVDDHQTQYRPVESKFSKIVQRNTRFSKESVKSNALRNLLDELSNIGKKPAEEEISVMSDMDLYCPDYEEADSIYTNENLCLSEPSPMENASAPLDINNLDAFKAPTFQQLLFKHIDNKGLKDSQVYKAANLDRRLFSRIRSNVNYQPNKNTAIAFCIALQLDLDNALDLMQSASLSLSKSNTFDLIIRYCIENKIYDIMLVNEMLFEHCDKTLSNVA